MLQGAESLTGAVAQETPFDDASDLLDALRLQVATFGILEMLLNRLPDRSHILADDADLPGRLPAPNALLRGALDG